MKKFLICVAFIFVLSGCSNVTKDTDVVDDVTQYSNISVEQLKEIMGEPVSRDNWTNKTSKGNFKVTTWEYDKDTMQYEFIIADKKVVRATINSGDYWNGDGNRFEYDGHINTVFEMFNVVPDKSARKKDTASAYILRPANNIISEFNIQDINNNTFGMVKVTYNNGYFD